jgi:DHA2 family multidrug resistance protein
MLCGAAQSLEQIVLFRILQGGSGAFLTPMAQAIIMDIYPKEKHQSALAVWSGSLMLSPLIGPTLGGYLSELYTWRWAFYINLPFGILGTLWTLMYLPDSRRDQGRRFDFLGFGLLGVAIGSFQLMLDRGTTLDWFSSREIVVETIVAALTFYLFIAHTLTARTPFLSPGSFKDFNFLLGLATLFIVMSVMFGNVAMVPTMLQTLLGYPVLTTGWLVFPRGFGALVTMVMVSQLPRTVDARVPILGGLIVTAISLYLMSHFTLGVSQQLIVLTGLIQGFGSGMVFTPLVTLAFSTMEARHRTEGTAMFSLIRNIGIAIGVSTNSTILERQTQINHAALVDYITPFSRALRFLSPASVMEGIGGAVSLDAEINRQAGMIAYDNLFRLSAALLMVGFVMVAMTLVYQKTPRAQAVEA